MTSSIKTMARLIEIANTITSKKPGLIRIIFVLIILLSASLRSIGLDWDAGYPYTPHPDERAILMKVGEISFPSITELKSLLIKDESTWNPRWFPYGSFPLYFLKCSQLAMSQLLNIEITDLRMLGRIISVIADTATVATVFFVGSAIYGRREGLLAAALVALSVIHIQLSHFFAVDTIAALTVVITIFFLIRVAKNGRKQDSLAAGCIVGMGLATKISIAPILLSFGMAHLIYCLNQYDGDNSNKIVPHISASVSRFAIGIIGLLVTFTITQPYAFIDFTKFVADITEQSEMVRGIRDYPYTRQYADTLPYWYQVKQLSMWGLGIPLGIIAWAGLIYVSLRGLTLKLGASYLVLGWVFPAVLLILSNSNLAVILAISVSILSLLSTLPFRSKKSREIVVILAWVVPYILITGSFHVKFLRYLIPVTPFLILFGSAMLFDLLKITLKNWPKLLPILLSFFAFILIATAFYAFSYTRVYLKDHPAVSASTWINDNVQGGSVILKEHWEEGIPGLYDYEIRELQLYNEDTKFKIQNIAKELQEADFLVFYSNRLYGTIPRLKDRYPITTKYYDFLFSGKLGYQVVHTDTSYPNLMGITIVDDTFSRPGLTNKNFKPWIGLKGLVINLGFADESFTVYDHPMVIVFENKERKSMNEIRDILIGDGLVVVKKDIGLMFSNNKANLQQKGGTWNNIFGNDSWVSRYPIFSWVVIIELLSFLMIPITVLLFKNMRDLGYLLAKPIGLLAVSILTWILASYHLVAFSQKSIWISTIFLMLISFMTLLNKRNEIYLLLRRAWRQILIAEIVFLLAFLSFVVVRMANPDLWHPHLGGEKPMELAYLTATVKSTYMPPYDPWFAGGYINYYYFGYFIVATLIHFTSVEPNIAFNLAIPLFFAMTAGAGYSLAYNLASGPFNKVDNGYRPMLAGVSGAMLITVLGNLDGGVQIITRLWDKVSNGANLGEFDFWRSTRMMGPDPPGHEITEFPFFTYLFGDLHAHMMAIPFTILAVALSLTIIRGAAEKQVYNKKNWFVNSRLNLARLIVLGVVVGSLRVINTWDFPTYLLIASVAVLVYEYFNHGGPSLTVLIKSTVKIGVVYLSGYIVFLPYHLFYEAFFIGIEPTTNTTKLSQFLLINGLFIFIISTFLVIDSMSYWNKLARKVKTRLAVLYSKDPESSSKIDKKRLAGLVTVAVLLGYLICSIVFDLMGSTIPMAAFILAGILLTFRKLLRSNRIDRRDMAFVMILAGTAMAIVIAVDIIRVSGDIDRMNTVFKFYLQVWVLLAIVSSALIIKILNPDSAGYRFGRLLKVRNATWMAVLGILLIGVSIYPVLGTQSRLKTRFKTLPLTLNGMEYMKNSVYKDQKGEIDLKEDYEAISWIRENIEGSHIILEGLTPNYRWGGRVSAYTGLPNVIGWRWHQEQQRWDYRWAIEQRAKEVNLIYSTDKPSIANQLIEKYGISYIYIGQLERLYYPEAGIKKFEEGMFSSLEKLYKKDDVSIYKVRSKS